MLLFTHPYVVSEDFVKQKDKCSRM